MNRVDAAAATAGLERQTPMIGLDTNILVRYLAQDGMKIQGLAFLI
jgi:hypothetical protein